ncbi:hypothetical protein Hanom_Chr16g01483201 [Helianthus anomalus]
MRAHHALRIGLWDQNASERILHFKKSCASVDFDVLDFLCQFHSSIPCLFNVCFFYDYDDESS